MFNKTTKGILVASSKNYSRENILTWIPDIFHKIANSRTNWEREENRKRVVFTNRGYRYQYSEDYKKYVTKHSFVQKGRIIFGKQL